MHCHLLAGLDDGPRTEEEALQMCHLAYGEGTRLMAATAHQNEEWSTVTPERIREATRALVQQLHAADLPLTVYPCAEVMVHAELENAWDRGQVLSVADRGRYLLIELPHGLFLDLCEMVGSFLGRGVRPILAHPERQPELLHDAGRIEALIEAGCLVQVSSRSVTDPRSREDERALKDWFKRGVVHLLGSDGHRPGWRPPRLADAYQRIVHWAGIQAADRVCCINGTAILHGLPLRVPKPEARRSAWLPGFW
jgi:protein-tyrosine phosphatase